MELPHIPRSTTTILSTDPSRNKNFSVAITYGIQPSRLAFYNHGDEEWTDLNGEHQEYYDIIFHNDQLFALVAMDMELSPQKAINLQPSLAKEIDLDYISHRDKFSTNTCLVESSGEILSVVRCIGNFVNEEGKTIHEIDVLDELNSPCPCKTLHFYVLKLNFAANKWEKVDCLPNWCEENSIYFTDDRWDEIEMLGDNDSCGGHDMGALAKLY
ncbi:hypothetical protein ACLB2K_064835 [Fragaria x ananassa]